MDARPGVRHVAGSHADSDCIACAAGRYGVGGSTTSACSGDCAAGRYSRVADISGPAAWDSSENLDTGSAGHINGLMCFNDRLVSPKKTQQASCGNAPNISNGDFNSIAYAHAGNPDYSGIGSTESVFYREFINNSGGDEAGWSVLLSGDCEIVSSSTSPLGGNQVRIFFKLPENPGIGAPGTGWMDFAEVFNAGNWLDDDGLHVGTFNPTIGGTTVTNEASIGTRSVRSGDSIIMKVVARKSWAGHLSQIEVIW